MSVGPYGYRVNDPTRHDGMGVMADGQANMAHLRSIFGPSRFGTVNVNDNMPVTIHTIKDYYAGSNEQLATDVVKKLANYNSWHFTACPLERTPVGQTTLSKRVKKTLVYETHLPDSRAPFGTVNRISSSEESTEWTLQGHGIGLRFEYKVLMTPAGPVYMREGLDVIGASICDFHKLSVLSRLLQTGLPDKVRDTLGQPYKDIADMMTGKWARNFCCLSKKERMIWHLHDDVIQQCSKANLLRPTFGVFPAQAAPLVVMGTQATTEISRDPRATTNLALGSNGMPTVQDITPYLEQEYSFANVANRRITKPLERIFQAGWHYISAPNLAQTMNPKYNEMMCRSFQQLDLSGNVSWATKKFTDQILADQNFDKVTGDLKVSLLSRLEGDKYKTEFSALGEDYRTTCRNDAAVHPYITTIGGVGKLVYFFGDMDEHYVPDTFLKHLGISAAKLCQRYKGGTIDFGAINAMIEVANKSRNYPLIDGNRFSDALGFLVATGMDFRNKSTMGSLFAKKSPEGSNYLPIITDEGEVKIYVNAGDLGNVYVTYLPNYDAIYSLTPSADSVVLRWDPEDPIPGASEIPDLRYIASSGKYDSSGVIKRGIEHYNKFVDYVMSVFGGETISNLLLNPDLCPAHLRVPGESPNAKRKNIQTAFSSALGLVGRPVALRGARYAVKDTEGVGPIIQVSVGHTVDVEDEMAEEATPGEPFTEGFGRFSGAPKSTRKDLGISNDQSGVRDLAAILGMKNQATVADKVINANNISIALSNDLQEGGVILKRFDKAVLGDSNTAGLTRIKSKSLLYTWVKSMIAKNYSRGRITRALNRAVNHLATFPDYIIDSGILATFEANTFEDEEEMATHVPSKRRTRLQDYEGARRTEKKAGVKLEKDAKILSISVSGSVFESLTDEQLARLPIVPTSTFDVRKTAVKANINRVIGRAGNYESNSMENTIFGHPDLAFKEESHEPQRGEPSKRARGERSHGGVALRSGRPGGQERDNRVQGIVDDDEWIYPSQDGHHSYPVEYAQHGLENLFFAERINMLNNSPLEPIERAFAMIYMCLPLNSKNFLKLAENGYTVPVTYISFNPFITLKVGSAIYTRPGVGVVETNFSTVMINVDTNVLAVDVNTTFESGVGILYPRGVFVVDGVMFLGYEGGSGPAPIYTIDSSSTPHKGRMLGAKSADFNSSRPWDPRNGESFTISVGPMNDRTTIPKALDVGGPLDPILFNASNSKRFQIHDGHVQQVDGLIALHMATNLNKSKREIVGVLDSYLVIALNAERRVNTLTTPGGQMNWNMELGDYKTEDSQGTGPIGNVRPGTATALNGESGTTEGGGFEVSVVG